MLEEERAAAVAASVVDPMAFPTGRACKTEERAMQEMDQEKLIENVRACEALYVTAHVKYSDIRYKENAWKEIGNKIQQPAIACKKAWTNLRDSFRRALRKRRKTKSGRPVSKIKKWKFEDEMAFLTPHLQDREMSTNLEKDTDDNNEDEDDEDNEDADNNDYRDNDRDDNIENNVRDTDTDDDNVDESDYNNLHIEKLRRKKAISRKSVKQATVNKGHKFDSDPVLIKYLLGDKRSANVQTRQQDPEPSAMDMFFSSIATTVKTFSPYYQNIAKSKIFNIISDLEMKQIMRCQQEQVQSPNTSMQRQSYAPMSTTISPEILESYHNGSYDGCSASLVSPSTIACPSPSSSHNFPGSVPIAYHDGLSIKKE